ASAVKEVPSPSSVVRVGSPPPTKVIMAAGGSRPAPAVTTLVVNTCSGPRTSKAATAVRILSVLAGVWARAASDWYTGVSEARSMTLTPTRPPSPSAARGPASAAATASDEPAASSVGSTSPAAGSTSAADSHAAAGGGLGVMSAGPDVSVLLHGRP